MLLVVVVALLQIYVTTDNMVKSSFTSQPLCWTGPDTNLVDNLPSLLDNCSDVGGVHLLISTGPSVLDVN